MSVHDRHGEQNQPDDLLTIREAATLRSLPLAQVEVMIEEGLLSRIDDEGSRVRRAEVLAARATGA